MSDESLVDLSQLVAFLQKKGHPSLTCWGVVVNTDLTEGRGRDYVKYVCETSDKASLAAKGQGVMGRDGNVVEGVVKLHPVWQDTLRLSYPHDPRIAVVTENMWVDPMADPHYRERHAARAKLQGSGLTQDELALLGYKR